jgi:hypothetical protein
MATIPCDSQKHWLRKGILVEQTARGWIVSLSDESNIGPFRKPKDAWNWVNRQPSRRYGR